MYPNWFAHYADKWFEKHLSSLAGRPALRFLQIGAFTGDASLWLCEHILTGLGSVLVDVDTWEGSDEPEHEALDFADVQRVYDQRTADLRESGRIAKVRASSDEFFRTRTRGLYDFIYIDGDHQALTVMRDGMHAWPLLRAGGLIAFDDYLWESGKDRLHDPGPAIDAFADLYSDRLELLDHGLQVWLRKVPA